MNNVADASNEHLARDTDRLKKGRCYDMLVTRLPAFVYSASC